MIGLIIIVIVEVEIMKQKKRNATMLIYAIIIFTVSTCITPALIANATDESQTPSTWADEEVNAAIETGLVPQELQMNYQTEITRGEVSHILVRLIENVTGQAIETFMEIKGVTINSNAFIDTENNSILAANALGILQGVGNNRFDPDGILTRAQIAVIINRLARVVGVETDNYTHTFTDIEEEWIDIELGWPSHVEIINGIGDNKFDPYSNLTIETAIVIAYRALSPLTRYSARSLLEGKTADTQYSMLNDRFSILMPEGSIDESIQNDGIMGPISDSQSETMIVLSENDQTFYAYAQELLWYSTGDLTNDISLFLADDLENNEIIYDVSEVIEVSDMQYITFTPSEIDSSRSALLKGALLKMPDNTLVYLGIVANPAALIYIEDCVHMADAVIDSIVEGTRLLNFEQRTINILGGIVIESEYIFINDRGYDFDVYYFYKIVTIGESQPAFGIYIGGYPSQFGSRLEFHSQINDVIIGQDITWDMYTSEESVIGIDSFIETLLVYEEHNIPFEWYTYMHIFVSPRNEHDWELIQTMLHSLD